MKHKDVEWAILCQDYATVKKAITTEFDLNAPLKCGQDPVVEAAQPAEDPKMLRILWEAGANPTTPFLEDVFKNFENGADDESAIPDYADEDDEVDVEELEDLTEDFSVEKLTVTGGVLRLAGEHSEITLPCTPFLLNGEIESTEICFESIGLPESLKDISYSTFTFPANPQKGYIDGSIYLQSAHHPIDVTAIKFGKYQVQRNKINATIEMRFVFSHESPELEDQSMTKRYLLSVETE